MQCETSFYLQKALYVKTYRPLQVSADPLLSQYDVIVLDEVHERHLQGDFLLGVMKCLVRQRPELRLVLMSATINIQLFRDYFHGQAPVRERGESTEEGGCDLNHVC